MAVGSRVVTEPSRKWSPAAVKKIQSKFAEYRESDDGLIKFSREVLRTNPTPQQAEMLAAIKQRTPDQMGVSVVSGQGVGKTVGAAMALWGFLSIYPGSLVPCTAPKHQQIFDLLWAEANVLYHRSPWLQYDMEFQATRIQPKRKKGKWEAIGRTAREKENMAGFHADHMLIIMEEASGVADDIHETLQATLSQDNNQILMISNGTRNSGAFYKSHNDPKESKLWSKLRFSAEDSPVVSKAHLRRLAAKWGIESSLYKVRVLGEFASRTDHGMFDMHWIHEAASRELFDVQGEPMRWGMDVARFGGDWNCLVGRRGENIKHIERWQGEDTMFSAKHANAITQQYDDSATLCIDEGGPGVGVIDKWVELYDAGQTLPGLEMIPVNSAWSSNEPTVYAKYRDEMWGKMSNRYKHGAIAFDRESVSQEDIEILEGELAPVEFKYNIESQKKVDSKDIMREKIGHSPDIADALMLSFADADVDPGVMII